MFALGLLFGIYSYLIFVLGILGILSKSTIIFTSLFFLFGAIYYFYKKKEDLPKIDIKKKSIRPLLLLFSILAFVNLVGALSPEYSFDALWYHLSLPKIYLAEGMIFSIPQGIFSYSPMPKLGEMLFTPFVAFELEVFAKLTQWLFGILTSVVVYKIARRYLSDVKSFIAVLIFYGSIIVAWESTVAYIDLIRAFFESLALWGVLVWFENKDRKILVEAAVFAGLAISTKLLALGSLPIFIILFLLFEKNKLTAIKTSVLFVLVALVAVSPWLIVSFMSTGNPVYPILSNVYPEYPLMDIINTKSLIFDHIRLALNSDILISPIFIMFLPLTLIFYKKFSREQKVISVYVLLALIVWYFIPRTGGGRFIIPYLPAASILCALVIAKINNEKVRKFSYFLVILVFMLTIAYRGMANVRYVPVITGIETEKEFLSKKLNFNFGDFYDTDGFFKDNIKEGDKVLLVGFHNIYYVDFPFVHESYIKPGEGFNYIAVQDSELPERFENWNLVHANSETGVKVYSLGGATWHY